MRVEGAIMLVPEIIDNGALTSLDLSNNNIGQLVMSNGWQEDADGYWKEVDGEEIVEMQIPAGEQLATAESPVGAIAIANAVKDMGAMTSLNLASNQLGAKGARIVAEAIKVTIITPAIIFTPFSCPSDFSIHCCCLLLSPEHGGDDEPQSCKQPYLLDGQHGWDQGHFQCYKGACGHFGTIFISI